MGRWIDQVAEISSRLCKHFFPISKEFSSTTSSSSSSSKSKRKFSTTSFASFSLYLLFLSLSFHLTHSLSVLFVPSNSSSPGSLHFFLLALLSQLPATPQSFIIGSGVPRVYSLEKGLGSRWARKNLLNSAQP